MAQALGNAALLSRIFKILKFLHVFGRASYSSRPLIWVCAGF